MLVRTCFLVFVCLSTFHIRVHEVGWSSAQIENRRDDNDYINVICPEDPKQLSQLGFVHVKRTLRSEVFVSAVESQLASVDTTHGSSVYAKKLVEMMGDASKKHDLESLWSFACVDPHAESVMAVCSQGLSMLLCTATKVLYNSEDSQFRCYRYADTKFNSFSLKNNNVLALTTHAFAPIVAQYAPAYFQEKPFGSDADCAEEFCDFVIGKNAEIKRHFAHDMLMFVGLLI